MDHKQLLSIPLYFFIFFNLSTAFANQHPACLTLPMSGPKLKSMHSFNQQITHLMCSYHIPGAAIAIFKNGHLYYTHGYGYADVNHHRKTQPNTLFRIASISKTITAITTLQLAQLGFIHLNTPIVKILNKLKPYSKQKMTPGVNAITTKDLLHMASGWDGDFDGGLDVLFGPWDHHFVNITKDYPPVSCLTAARYTLGQPLQYRAGTHFSYANINYCLLGLIIDKTVANKYGYQPYEKYVQQQVLAPLGIHNMFIGNTRYSQRNSLETHYYGIQKINPNKKLIDPRVLPYSRYQLLHYNFANGGWVASAVDLGKIANALANGKILNKKMLHLMLQKPKKIPYIKSALVRGDKIYYGMGWFIKQTPQGKIWVTHGSFTGTNSLILHKPNGDIYAIIFNKKPSPFLRLMDFRKKLKKIFMHDETLPKPAPATSHDTSPSGK